MFFRKRPLNYSITRSDYSSNQYTVDSLSSRIRSLDNQIAELNRTIFEAQSVRVRSLLSLKKNIFEGFQQKILESTLRNSVSWHQNRLLEICAERKKLQEHLERLTGQYWPNQFKRLLRWILLWIALIAMCTVLVMGLFAALYALPIFIILGLIIFSISNFKKIRS